MNTVSQLFFAYALSEAPVATTSSPSAAPAPAPAPAPVLPLPVARFITDVTVPDGTIMLPQHAFTKTWRFRNEVRGARCRCVCVRACVRCVGMSTDGGARMKPRGRRAAPSNSWEASA